MSTAPLDLEVALGRFARQAQSLTLAGGASIALASPEGGEGVGSGDEMTCRASSGKAAPLVGARLRLVPGLQREWVREGKPLRCDDSETDTRVDRDRCRKLGIRSVVTVPLKNNESVVGVIEIFSTRTKAFTESHMAKLHVLAERITDAVTADSGSMPASPLPELIWADVFVESRLPWKRLLQSALCHLFVVGMMWDISLNWAKTEQILRASTSQRSRLTYYPSPSFPAARSHHPQAESSASAGNSPAPLVVKKAGPRPDIAAPAVKMPVPGRVELAGLRSSLPAGPPVLGSVASPPRASLAAAGPLDPSRTPIVAPPPPLGGALRQRGVSSPGSFAVGPAPVIGADAPLRTMVNAGVGHSNVVGPAPGLPAHQGVTGPGMSIGGVRAVVGPPVSMPLHEGSGGSGLVLGGGAAVVGPPSAMPLHEGTGGSPMALGGGNGVVAPAPTMQGGFGGGSRINGATLAGGDAVIAPAPGITGGVRSNASSAGFGGTGTIVAPPPGIPTGTGATASSGFGGSGLSVQPGPPAGGTGTGSGQGISSSGNASGSGADIGAGSGSGSGAGSGSGSSMAAAGAGSNPADPKSIRTSLPPQAPTHVDDPAGKILDVPVRVLGLALALPASSFFSNYEVFIAEREYAKNEKQLIKLVYESRPTQQRLSDYGVNIATTYKLRVKRDPTCDESPEQITGGHFSELQSATPGAPLTEAAKDSVLPCYRTTADDYQKAAAKKR